jgi:hypothetical protein
VEVQHRSDDHHPEVPARDLPLIAEQQKEKGPLPAALFLCIGGAVERSRTSDLLITNQLLYQLSYNSAIVDYTGSVGRRARRAAVAGRNRP